MKAAILERIGAPLAIREVSMATHGEHDLLLKRGQVLVKVLCSGICGSQLQEIDGIKGRPEHLPHLLGHEGCGIVIGTDLDVQSVAKGDKVVMHWRKGWGIEAEPAVYDHGKIKAGPITTFSEFAVVSENRVTKIPDDVPNDLAALLGCAFSTALSIIENEAKPQPNETLMIVGAGGVGLALIFAARKSSTCRIVAADSVYSLMKVNLVMQLGGRFFPHPRCDVVIDTVGDANSKNFLREDGRYISLQANGTSAGGFDPTFDIPRYVEMWRSGKLNGYEKIITHRISLDQINEGIQLMREGNAGRVMIEMNR